MFLGIVPFAGLASLVVALHKNDNQIYFSGPSTILTTREAISLMHYYYDIKYYHYLFPLDSVASVPISNNWESRVRRNWLKM